jgi:hypothetical protein
MAQQLIVLGDPITCATCHDTAAMMIRQRNADDTYDVLTYCDNCWLFIRRAYAPLVAHDVATATAEVERVVREGA